MVRGAGKAIGVPGDRAGAAQPSRPSAHVARFPLDLVVVELEVEVADARVATIYHNQLKDVRLVGVLTEIADARPVDSEGVMTVHHPGPVRHYRTGAGVNVPKEWSDDLGIGARETEGREGAERTIERNVPIVVNVRLRVRGAEQVRRESEVDQTGGSVVVSGKIVRGEACVGPDCLRRQW